MVRSIAGTAGAAALVAILVAGTALRLHHLGTQSLWLDEAFSLTIADSTIDYILETTAEDVHPPLYYFLLYGWVHLIGATEWTGRLFSVVMSLVLLVVVYQIGTRMEDRRVGLMAAGLLAVSPFQIEYAQEARMYALLACLAALATYCLWRMCETLARGRPEDRQGHARRDDPESASRVPRPNPDAARAATWWAIGYAACASALTYTHVHGWFVLAAHGCVILIELLRRGWGAEPIALRWVGAMLAVAAMFLLWLPTFAIQVRQVRTHFWIPAPARDDLFTPIETYAGSPTLLWILGSLAAAGAVVAWRRPMRTASSASPRPAIFLLPWLILPIVLPFAISLTGSSIFLPKYTIAASIPFALLAGFGLARASGWWQIAAAATVVAVIVSQSLSVVRTYHDGVRKDDWRSAVREVEALARPGDRIVFHPFFTQIPYGVYRTRTDLVEAPFPKHGGLLTTTTLPFVLHQLRGDDRSWLVLMSFDARKPVLVAALEARCGTVERHRAFHIDMYLCETSRNRPTP
jgi:uncharacterized membrane protein